MVILIPTNTHFQINLVQICAQLMHLLQHLLHILLSSILAAQSNATIRSYSYGKGFDYLEFNCSRQIDKFPITVFVVSISVVHIHS